MASIRRWVRALAPGIAGGVLACLAVASFAGSPLPADDWQFDRIYLRNGRVCEGLVIEESPKLVQLWRVQRKPGQPARRALWTWTPPEIARIERLDEPQRRILADRVDALDPENEKRCLEKLPLFTTSWNDDPKGALCYRSEQFVLVSNAREDIVRRAAFRLENIYGAFARFLPPHCVPTGRTRILLAKSVAEYQEMLRQRGQVFLNSAMYDRQTNEILCASDLERLSEEAETNQKLHQQTRSRLRAQEQELGRQYRNKVPAKLLDELAQSRAQLDQADRFNKRQVEQETEHLFQLLYHETWHAYVATNVCPPGKPALPCWLDEGLAQHFENAILDGTEVRVGHVDSDHLERLRHDARKGELVSLSELLRAGPRQFIAHHIEDKVSSDRYYLYSWAVAHQLAFERDALRRPDFDRYVQALTAGADAEQAFEQWLREPLNEFEKGLRREFRLTMAGL